MTERRAILQWYNNKLVEFMEELLMKKKEIDEHIGKLKEDKSKIQNEIVMLSKQLDRLCERLLWKYTLQKKLHNIVTDGVFVYDKILDSSKILITILQREIENLDRLIELKRLFMES